MKKLLLLVISTALLQACAHTTDNNILTGDWVISSSVGGVTPIMVNCSLIQAGTELSGTCTPVMENAEAAVLTGSVDGSKASWGYSVVFNGNPGTVDFFADAYSSTEISGTLSLSGTEAPFTAVKQ